LHQTTALELQRHGYSLRRVTDDGRWNRSLDRSSQVRAENWVALAP
jgi:hypothetical protein